MCAAPAAPPAASASGALAPVDILSGHRGVWLTLPSRVVALCIVELQKMRHDQTELLTRIVQPVLWLLIFGETFSRIRAIPTGKVPYLDFIAPGIMAQSALFLSIFFGIQIIWERDAGVLAKLLVTPTPRAALVTGKAFAAGMRSLTQAIAIMVLAAILGVALTTNPLRILGALVVVVLSAGFFACLSMVIAGVVLSRDRLMGIGQVMTMPLFFASNALYPVSVMPGWVGWITRFNPMSYEVDALRGLLLGLPADMPLDVGILVGALVVAIAVASALLGRLAR